MIGIIFAAITYLIPITVLFLWPLMLTVYYLASLLNTVLPITNNYLEEIHVYIVLFIIGMLTGWIYGKIKNRNKI